MMYYSAYDKQTHSYFKTGRNSRTRAGCVRAVVDYLIEGSELPASEYESLPDNEILELFDVRIDQHSRKLTDKRVPA